MNRPWKSDFVAFIGHITGMSLADLKKRLHDEDEWLGQRTPSDPRADQRYCDQFDCLFRFLMDDQTPDHLSPYEVSLYLKLLSELVDKGDYPHEKLRSFRAEFERYRD
jgi:hypothetical protein